MPGVVELLLAGAGLINFVPVGGVISGSKILKAYGLPSDALSTPDVRVLLRHRAALFGIVGGGMLASCFKPELQPTALGVGLASMVSFLAIAVQEGGPGALNGQLKRVMTLDVAGIGFAVAAACAIGYRDGWFA